MDIGAHTLVRLGCPRERENAVHGGAQLPRSDRLAKVARRALHHRGELVERAAVTPIRCTRLRESSFRSISATAPLMRPIWIQRAPTAAHPDREF
jgi:hypothetical protein